MMDSFLKFFRKRIKLNNFLTVLILLTALFCLVGNCNAEGGGEQVNARKKDWKNESRLKFQKFAREISSRDLEKLKIELITVTPGPTVTTAFGHSALRVKLGKNYGPTDFFVDFGQYEENIWFLINFFKGNARFYVNTLPFQSAYEEVDSSGRGLLVTRLKLTPEEKRKLLDETLVFLEDDKGYEYNNYTSNCVTYISALIQKATGRKLALKPERFKDKAWQGKTWRERVTPYSDQLIWLRINEKLLFDHVTDKKRGLDEYHFLPNDLQYMVEDMGLAERPPRVLILHRFPPPSGGDFFGALALLVMSFVILSSLPFKIFEGFRNGGRKIFALWSGIPGIVVFLVWGFTTFDFMDETLMVLVSVPLDLILFKDPEKTRHPAFLFYYAILRILMLCAALVLMLTVYDQRIESSLSFAFLFFGFYAYHLRLYLKNSPPVGEAKTDGV